MSRRKPRGLRPDEEELWSRIAKTAKPMHASRPAMPGHTGVSPKPAPEKPIPQDPIEPFRVGQKSAASYPSHDLSPSLSGQLAGAPVTMDKKAYRRMSQGRLMPEARIDLHGMTLGTAHGALTSFILSSQAAGRRLVLVITGKGREVDDDSPIPTRTGVLRHQLPHWLASPPLAQAVLQVSEAHRRHGGSGAFYVYLRRR